VEQPITTSPTVGTDGLDFWVYFGTGRFFDPEDKTNDYSNSVQSFYGIREPVSNNFTDLFYTGVLPQPTDGDGNPPCQLSWAQVLNDRLGTPNGGKQSDGTTDLTGRGGLGLMGVHNIEILSAEYLDQPGNLKCVDDPDEVDPLYCLPAELREKRDNNGDLMLDPDGDPYTASYKDFILYLTGDYIVCNGTEHGYDGWYRDFPDPRERNLGQASLLGGLLTFNTYQPFTRDLCQTEGRMKMFLVKSTLMLTQDRKTPSGWSLAKGCQPRPIFMLARKREARPLCRPVLVRLKRSRNPICPIRPSRAAGSSGGILKNNEKNLSWLK
jgi:type IV pilus assembly protein PilY1